MKRITLALLISVTALTGCKSTPKYQEGVSFDDNSSFALNIANQTMLVDNIGMGLPSPLKDFTQKQVDDVRANVHKSYGSASKVLGALSVLSGNFTGVIDIAGGYAADFGNSNHPAIRPSWIIALDKDSFSSKEEALKYAQTEVTQASVSTLEQFGEVIRKVNGDTGAQLHEIAVNGKNSTVGLVSNPKSRVRVEEGLFYRNSSDSGDQSFLIGFSDELYSSFGNVPVVTIANSEIDSLDIKESEFYKEVTKKLPEGFYLYMPSFPRYNAYNKNFTDLDAVVPSIYYQGEKHDFIKP